MDPLNFDPYGLGIDPAAFAAFAAQIGQPAAPAAAAPEAPPMPAAQTIQAPTPSLAAAVPAGGNAYLAANPDVAKFAADAVAAKFAPTGWSGGVLDSADEAAAYHAWAYGGNEGRDGAATLAATVPTYAAPATPGAPAAAPVAQEQYIDPHTGKKITRDQLAVNPEATWADLYMNSPDLQQWAVRAMQGEFAPAGWAGGAIDSLEEATNYWQQTYGDSGTGIRFTPGAAPTDFAYDPAKGNVSALRNPTGVVDASKLANPDVKTLTQLAAQVPAAPAAAPAAAPKAANGLQFDDPALLPANDKYKTPYYAAYTNDNDFAGAVMAGQGQKIRLVDQTTGEVVYEGVGQEGAKKAVELANAASQAEGRKAAWAIQADYDGTWTTQAAERYDPKDKGLFGSLMDVLLPIAGALLMPVTGGMSAALAAGLGAAGGSALSSVAQGRSLSDTLTMAALSGLGAGVVGPAVGNAVGSLGGASTSIIPGSDALLSASIPGAVSGIAAPVATGLTTGAANSALGTLVSELVVQGIPAATATQIAMQALGAAGGSALGASVTGGSSPSSPAQQNADGSTTVDELVVTPTTGGASGITPIDLVSAIPAVTGVTAPTVNEPITNVNDTDRDILAPGLAGAAAAAASGNLQNWMDAYGVDTDMLGLLLTLGGALGGSGGGTQQSGTGLNIGDANIAAAGTRASLGDIFTAQLPTATFGSKTPRAVEMPLSGWKSYGIGGPEQSFFSSVPEVASGVSGLSANLSKIPDAEIGDLNNDGRIDSIDRMLFAAAIRG